MPGMIVGSEVLASVGDVLKMSGMITLVGNGFNDGMGADEGEMPGMTVGSVVLAPVGKIPMDGEVVAGPTEPALGTSVPVIGGDEVLGEVPTGATLAAGISVAASVGIKVANDAAVVGTSESILGFPEVTTIGIASKDGDCVRGMLTIVGVLVVASVARGLGARDRTSIAVGVLREGEDVGLSALSLSITPIIPDRKSDK